jgi:alpha-galactosidase
MPKIVLIGAGSVVFGAGTLIDLIHFRDQLAGSTIALVDVDAGKAALMGGLAERINREAGSPYTVSASTERRDVLEDADFVITSPAIKREELWKVDWDIIRAAGIKQTYGECGGPGALSHTLRNVPMILSICRDVEKLAPRAWIINFTNPEARICMAIDRHTSLRFVGLCHQIYEGYRSVSAVLSVPAEQLDIKAAGINHFTWIYDIRDKLSGQPLYEAFRARLEQMPADFQPLSRRMLEAFGLFPTAGDHHLAEYLSYAWQFVGLRGRDWDRWQKRKTDAARWARGVVEGTATVEDRFPTRTTESVADIIAAITTGQNNYQVSLDLRNNGLIPNLAPDAIVEVPGVVSGDGIRGLQMAPLPAGIAAMAQQQIAIQGLAVEAAVHGSRQLALQAMLLDPVVCSYETASAVLDQLLEAQRAYISPALFREAAVAGS